MTLTDFASLIHHNVAQYTMFNIPTELPTAENFEDVLPAWIERIHKDATIIANKWLNDMDNFRFDLTYSMMDNEVKEIYDSLAWQGYFKDLV